MNEHRKEIEHCLNREQDERSMAASCKSPEAREHHFMLAERYADRAWSLSEAAAEEPYVPSPLWNSARRNA